MSILGDIIGANIKRLREASGLTIKEAGQKADFGPNQWGRYERGDQIPGDALLRKVAEVLEVPPEALVLGQGAPAGDRNVDLYDLPVDMEGLINALLAVGGEMELSPEVRGLLSVACRRLTGLIRDGHPLLAILDLPFDRFEPLDRENSELLQDALLILCRRDPETLTHREMLTNSIRGLTQAIRLMGRPPRRPGAAEDTNLESMAADNAPSVRETAEAALADLERAIGQAEPGQAEMLRKTADQLRADLGSIKKE